LKVAKNEQIDQVREHMRDGDGCAVLHHILVEDALPGNCRLFSRITLMPGSSIGEHEHMDETEIFYILSGRAQMTDNGKPIELEAGDSCLTTKGSHSIRCLGEEPLEILAVIIRG
jgi:mannose-6-phosphate isomerase-like protein (cupin superfamily)